MCVHSITHHMFRSQHLTHLTHPHKNLMHETIRSHNFFLWSNWFILHCPSATPHTDVWWPLRRVLQGLGRLASITQGRNQWLPKGASEPSLVFPAWGSMGELAFTFIPIQQSILFGLSQTFASIKGLAAFNLMSLALHWWQWSVNTLDAFCAGTFPCLCPPAYTLPLLLQSPPNGDAIFWDKEPFSQIPTIFC